MYRNFMMSSLIRSLFRFTFHLHVLYVIMFSSVVKKPYFIDSNELICATRVFLHPSMPIVPEELMRSTLELQANCRPLTSQIDNMAVARILVYPKTVQSGIRPSAIGAELRIWSPQTHLGMS